MEIKLNGNPHPISENHTLGELIASSGLQRKGVAVAVNREIVPRDQWPEHVLQSHDQVEIVQAIGGG
jgi:sulfur carrier protein